MFKLMLVDDETTTRDGILKSIRWSEIGIDKVEPAKNGVHAMEIAKNFVPDILLTDIKMPRMNGIELCHQIKALNPDCSLLIMSGYSEIDYLKSAIQLSALNFVDKPIDIDKLTQWIVRSIEVQTQLRKLKAHQENSKWLLRQDIALGFIRSEADTTRYLPALQELYPGISNDARCVCFIIKSVPDCKKTCDGLAALVVKEIEQLCHPFVVATPDKNTLVALLFFPTDCMPDTLPQYLYQRLTETADMSDLFLAFGEQTTGIGSSHHAYKSAEATMDRAFFSMEKRLLIHQKEPAASLNVEHLTAFLDSFITELTNGNCDGVIRRIDIASFQISMHPGTEKNAVIDLFFRMILALVKKKASICPDEISNVDYEWITHSSSLYDIANYVRMCTQRYFDEIYRNNSTTPMDSVLRIIHQEFHRKELSLQEISRRTYLSPSYICARFKDITGTTFIRYLTDYRIVQAMDLLKDKKYKINDIAQRIGFDNGNYFSKTFRKVKGITPLEYRHQFLINQNQTDTHD